MDKKTMLKIFGEAFLRSFVVLLGIMIVGFAVFFIVRVNTGKEEKKTKKDNIVLSIKKYN